MGILNVTPDSFSAGGRFYDGHSAVEHGIRMARDGADIIDVGGESTRPGAESVSVEDELERVIPVIEELAGKTDTVLSVDTVKSAVADRALSAGAHIVNDISALTGDPGMIEVVKAYGAGIILMHRRGESRTMQDNPQYENVVREVHDYLGKRIQEIESAGIEQNSIAIDPGIGFGKTAQHNIRLLADLKSLHGFARPVVIGLSRKSFLKYITGRKVEERLAGTLGALAYCVANGADVLRVHDVVETRDFLRVIDTLITESRKNAV